MAIIQLERFARSCESAGCSRTRNSWRTWLKSGSGYLLDGHWYCSSECFEQAVITAIVQLASGKSPAPTKPHRVPLGLLMLSRGMVSDDQLKKALKAQKECGTGRVGEWLRHMGAVSEEQVTQILGAQWAIPVFPLNQSRRFLDCAHLVPLALLKGAEMLPVHHLPSTQHLYVAFVDRVNYSALYALEKMLSCRTEPCLAAQSHIAQALEEVSGRPRQVEILVDNMSEPWQMAGAIAAEYARVRAEGAKLSGFDHFVWVRLVSALGYTDILFETPQRAPDLIVTPASVRDI